MSIIGALFKKPKAPDNPLQLQLSSNAPRKLLLGRTGTAGDFVYHGLTNSSRDLTRVIVLAGHRCNGLKKIWADGQQVYSGSLVHGQRTVITALNSRKKNYPQCWVTWYDGRANQTADSYLRTNYHSPIGWGVNDKLQGCSYIVVTTRHHEGDIDTVLDWIFEVEGARLYDRRLDSTAGGSGNQRWNVPTSWAYTDNAAVAVDHYQLGMLGGANADKLIFGMGLNTWQVPYDEFEANADTCDENVWGQSSYAVNGILSAADDHKDNIVKLAEAMASVPYDTGGRVIIRPQQARAVRLTLTDDDLEDKSVAELSESPSGDDIVNTVKGEYREPSVRHHNQPYPEQQDAALVSRDGRPFEVTLDLTLENSSSRAQRLANIELEVQKRRDIIRETFMPIANVLSIGDWFTRVSNLRGPVTKTYEVIDKTVNLDLTVSIEARETDPTITAFGENQARPVELPDPLDPFDPDRPAPPPATGTQDDEEGGGATRPVGVITLDPIDPIDGERYDYFEVEYGISTGGANPTIIAGTERKASFANEDQSVLTLPNLLPSTTYAWRLRTVSGVLYSDWGPFAEFTTTADFISTNTQAVGGTPAVAVLSELAAATQGLIDAAQARADEAQDRLDGDVAEAVARAADIVTEALARAEAIAEVDTRLTAVIAGYLGSEGSGATATNFADLSIWSRTISATDKDKFLALLASEALTVDGVPAYATTAKRLLRLTLAKPCTGGETIPVVARFKALTDGSSSGSTVTGYAYYWDAAGTTRVGFQSFADQKITVADRIVTLTGDLTTHANAEWYSPYFFVNRVTGENAQIAMLDILDGDAGGAPIEGSVQAAIAQEATARADADGALSTRIDTVQATANDAATSAQLTTEATARADADGALSTRIDTVQATANDAATSAQLNTEQTARADADGALSTRIDTVEATANGAATSAQLNTLSEASADADEALALSLDQVQSSLDALSGQPLNDNHNFDDWPVGAATPTGWTQFSGGTITKQAGEDGTHALRMQVATGQFGGFEQVVDIGEEDYTLKVKLKGISSNLNSCGVWVRIRNAANGTLVTKQYLLENLPDINGLTSVAIADYREWHFTIPAEAGADNAWMRYYGHFGASGPANAIQVDNFLLVGEPAESATVSFLRSALSDADGNFARAILNTAAGAARAFLEIGSVQRSDGTVDSNVGIGARRFEVSNPINGVWLKALEIANGVVTVFGDLNALGAMRFGTRRIAVALQPFRISNLADGDIINFGGDLTNVPDYEFFTAGLDPLLAGEEYDLTLTSLTSSGATVRAKVISGGSPTSHTDSNGSDGTAAEPDYVVHKGSANDATNGDYTFQVDFEATFEGGIGEGYFAFSQFEFFVRSGGTWTSLGTEQWSDNSNSSGQQPASAQWTKNFAGIIGQTSEQEFGVSKLNGTVNFIDTVTVSYSHTAASTTRTATPTGRKATVKVIPKNG